MKAKRAALEQARELGAGGAEVAGQRDVREERRARGADVGVGGEQLLLGGAHVGPAHQQVRRQAGGHLGGHLLLASGSGASRSAGSAWPSSSTSAFSSCARWRATGQRDARALEQRLGLAVVELGRGAVVEAQLGQAQSIPRASQRIARHAQQLVVGEQGEVGLATVATRLICAACAPLRSPGIAPARPRSGVRRGRTGRARSR